MLSILDSSNYLKGLLILARKDNRLVDNEREIIRSVAREFGFSRDFYEDTLKTLMSNKYIKDDPFKFSSKDVAEKFLVDGFKLALSDGNITTPEYTWLKNFAYINEIDNPRFHNILSSFLSEHKAS